ncbi:hypothetical protein EMIT0357P_130046 [Pseudomonas marginalis]
MWEGASSLPHFLHFSHLTELSGLFEP